MTLIIELRIISWQNKDEVPNLCTALTKLTDPRKKFQHQIENSNQTPILSPTVRYIQEIHLISEMYVTTQRTRSRDQCSNLREDGKVKTVLIWIAPQEEISDENFGTEWTAKKLGSKRTLKGTS